MNPYAADFQLQVDRYENTAEHNDRVFAEFTAATAADPVLADHRAYIERHHLGFGDRAFHAMWQQLLGRASDQFGVVDAMEIGVFKGQVICLWALLSKRHEWPLRLHGITPFAGQPLPPAGWRRSLRARLNPRFRERLRSGDFYAEDNYELIVRRHFEHYGLKFDGVRWIRGYSHDPGVLEATRTDRYHVLYIDAGHTYKAASADIANFAPQVVSGGWLVMDDASFDLPGSTFWKGYQSVTEACATLPDFGFRNVLNVGHNRIFQRR